MCFKHVQVMSMRERSFAPYNPNAKANDDNDDVDVVEAHLHLNIIIAFVTHGEIK